MFNFKIHCDIKSSSFHRNVLYFPWYDTTALSDCQAGYKHSTIICSLLTHFDKDHLLNELLFGVLFCCCCFFIKCLQCGFSPVFFICRQQRAVFALQRTVHTMWINLLSRSPLPSFTTGVHILLLTCAFG